MRLEALTDVTLTWPIVGIVLFGALLHASWNVAVKSSTDKALDTALIHPLGSIIALPLLLIVGLPPIVAWPSIFASVLIHIAYYVALTGAYKHGDMGLTYPLMRGVVPMLVAVSAFTTLGEHLSALAWSGVMGICCGVLVLGLSRHALDNRRASLFALVNAVVIAIYTVIDAFGARASGNPLQYCSFSTAGRSRSWCWRDVGAARGPTRGRVGLWLQAAR